MLLLVDPDPQFQKAATMMLDIRGGIFLARNAQQAKDLMSTVGADFSLMMIDLDLPGQNGFSLLQEMHRNFPDLPIIAISGVLQQAALDSAMLLGAADALRKPITPAWKIAMARVCAG